MEGVLVFVKEAFPKAHCYPSYNVRVDGRKKRQIDLYIVHKGVKVAVECDERGHRDRDPNDEQLREQQLQNVLPVCIN